MCLYNVNLICVGSIFFYYSKMEAVYAFVFFLCDFRAVVLCSFSFNLFSAILGIIAVIQDITFNYSHALMVTQLLKIMFYYIMVN